MEKKNVKPKQKKKKLPMMKVYEFVEPYVHHSNDKTGVDFYAFTCQGCNEETYVPDEYIGNIPTGEPMFFKKCGCTSRQELTTFHDDCEKCGGPIYLTPGTVMYKKYCEKDGNEYVPRKKYCDKCLDEVIYEGPCRNTACTSIGGDGKVRATFRDQLFYEKKNLSFPPTNCVVCREVKNKIKAVETSHSKCKLCNEVFPTTYKKMIMILKNEEQCKLPDTCPTCKNLSTDELNKVKQERELEDMKDSLRDDVLRLVNKKNQEEIEIEKERIRQEKEKNKEEIKKILEKKDKFIDWFVYMIFHYWFSKGWADSDIASFDRSVVKQYEQYKGDFKGLSQEKANDLLESLGKEFIQVVALKNAKLANLINKASENSENVRKMIGDFDGSVDTLKRVLRIASFPIQLKKEDEADVKNWINQGVKSKYEVDTKVIGQSKIQELQETILESKQQRFEKYGGNQDERSAMEHLLRELQEKERDIFDTIIGILEDPFGAAGITIVEADLAATKNIDSLIGKIRDKRKKTPDRLIYDFTDLIRGTLIFKNINEWKKAANIAISVLNDNDMLVSYEPVFLREKKEKMLQFNFDIKVDEEVFELQFKTQSSSDVLSIEHNLGYKGGDLSAEEEKTLEWFMNQFYLTEVFTSSDDDSDVGKNPDIIEV